MKYQLNKELKVLYRIKLPVNQAILPIANGFMEKFFHCKSDKKVKVTRHKIAGYKGDTVEVLVIEPHGNKEPLPCLVLFHGGGFMLRASQGHFNLAKKYAFQTPCKVIYADYRLAPEYPFPIPAEDCFAAYQWTVKNAKKLNIDRNRIAVGGDSAGGNLAAAVSLMARDRGLTMPCFQMLIYPVTDRRMETTSMKEFDDTPVWDSRRSEMMWEAYLGHQNPEHIEYASPLEAESFTGLPPVYMEVAEFDCLRDEGILYAKALKKAGIPTELHLVREASHGYESVQDSSIMKKCLKRRIQVLRKYMRREN